MARNTYWDAYNKQQQEIMEAHGQTRRDIYCPNNQAANASSIYYTSIQIDPDGSVWYWINGDTGYPLSEWTTSEAEADYQSAKAAIERKVSFMQANGFYD